MVKNRNGIIGVEGGKGTCFQWKEKGQCSQGDQCRFRPESNDRAQKAEHTAATPSEPSFPRDRRVSRKRSIRGRSNHGSILGQPCRYYLKGTCTRSLCEYWHRLSANFTKRKRRVKPVTNVCFRIMRLMNNQTKAKGYSSQKEEKATTKMRWLLWKVFHNWIVYHKIQMHSLGRKSRGNPTQKVLERNSKGTIRQVYATSWEYPGKERTIAGKNKCQSSSSAKSLR